MERTTFVGFGSREHEPGWFDEEQEIEVPISPRAPNPPLDLSPRVHVRDPNWHSGWSDEEEEEFVVEARWDPVMDPVEWAATFDSPDPENMQEANLQIPKVPVDYGLLPGHHRLPPYSETDPHPEASPPRYESLPPKYESTESAQGDSATQGDRE